MRPSSVIVFFGCFLERKQKQTKVSHCILRLWENHPIKKQETRNLTWFSISWLDRPKTQCKSSTFFTNYKAKLLYELLPLYIIGNTFVITHSNRTTSTSNTCRTKQTPQHPMSTAFWKGSLNLTGKLLRKTPHLIYNKIKMALWCVQRSSLRTHHGIGISKSFYIPPHAKF